MENKKQTGFDILNQAMERTKKTIPGYDPNFLFRQSNKAKSIDNLLKKEDKLTPEDEAAFLEGFNSIYEDDTPSVPSAKTTTAVNSVKNSKPDDTLGQFVQDMPGIWGKDSEKRDDSTTVVDHARNIAKGTAAGLSSDPLYASPYKIIDRYEVYDKNSSKYLNENGRTILKYPDGRFGIALRNSPEITQSKEIPPRVNSVFRIDNSHKNVMYPHMNINKHGIKEYNNGKLDKIADILNPRHETQKLPRWLDVDNFREKATAKVDKAIKLDNDILKGTAEGVIKYDHKPVGKGILNIAENSSKIAKVAKVGGKALGVAGTVVDAITVGQAVSDDLADDNRIGEDTVKAVARVGGEAAGAALGAKGGAAVGAWLFGTVATIASGGLLAAPAAALGGVIGGFLGGIGGSYVGGWLLEEGADAVMG